MTVVRHRHSKQEDRLELEGVRPVRGAAENATLFQELAPLRAIMFLLTLWPIQGSAQGLARTSLRSPVALYTMLAFALWSVLNAHVLTERCRQLGERAQDLVLDLILIALLGLHWTLPLCAWPAGKPLAGYFNAWTVFQDEWLQLTGRPLALGLRRRALSASVTGLALPILVVFASIQNGMAAAQAVAFLPPLCFFSLVGGVWSTLCHAVEASANHLRRLCVQENRHGDGLVHVRVRAYGSLWLRLRSLAAQTGEAQSGSLVVYTVFSMALALLAAIGVLIGLTRGAHVALLALFVVDNLRHIYTVHDAGHRAAHAASKALQYELLFMRAESELVNAEVRELLMATTLQSKSEPSVVTLGGFTTCSRSGIIEVYNMLLLNLLVLLQFAIAR